MTIHHRHRPRIAVAAAAALLALATGAGAMPQRPGEPPGDPMRDIARMVEELDLSPAQRERIGAILDEAMPATRKRMFEMSDARKALRRALEHEPVDEAALEQAARRLGELHGELILLHARTRARIRGVLTPAQRAELEARRTRSHGLRRPGDRRPPPAAAWGPPPEGRLP